MLIAAIQTDVVWHDLRANLDRVGELIGESAAAGATLAVLPEMFATGFSMDTDLVAGQGESVIDAMTAQAARHGLWVAGSVARFDGDDPRPVNEFVAVSPTGTTRRYAKRHPFSLGGEDAQYRSGDALVTIDIEGVRITPFVCYDLRFGPDFWDRALDTDAYVVVANWPTARVEHWKVLLRARAIENQAYVIGVNRVGEGGGVSYPGASAVVDPFGAVVAQAAAAESVLIAEIDPKVVAACRRSLPFLTDRGPGPTGEG